MQLEQPVLVVSGDGVVEISRDGTITPLVTGPVAFAVDDARGGLLFQIDSGRPVFAGFEGDPPPGDRTVVWWIPAGASTPQALLVPTPGEEHYLSLHDAYATAESFAVVYQRHEGTAPFDSDDGRDADMADTLRVYDAGGGTVTEVYRTRGFEWDLVHVSAGGGLLSATEVQILGRGCRLFDGATGEFVTRSGFPAATPACFEETGDCASACALSPDAGLVAYDRWERTNGPTWDIFAIEVANGMEAAKFSVPVHGQWDPAELDVHRDQFLLNRARERAYLPALLVDATAPNVEPTQLPIPGRARFATQPVAIAGPVAAPVFGLDYYLYGETGLFRVAAGVSTQLREEPVEHVWDDHMGGAITADATAIDILHLRAGDTTPTPIVRDSGYAYARFTGIVDGHPAFFFAGMPEGADLDAWPCSDWALNSRDLMTGEERKRICLPVEDGDLGIRSVGDGWLVGAPYGLCGGTGTAASIRFWDIAGNPIEVPTNPFPPNESCAPCELDALISPDGALLAYRHRPDAFHEDSPNYVGPACGGGAEQVEAWWDGSRDIPARIIVMDVETGAALWEMEVPADARLSDFDGRFVVVAHPEASLIYDSSGDFSPVNVRGQVTLIRRQAPTDDQLTLRPDGSGLFTFGDPADQLLGLNLTEVCRTGPAFTTGPLTSTLDGDACYRFTGRLDGDPADSAARVAELGAGARPSC